MVFVGVLVFGCCLRTLGMYKDGCVLWVGFRIAGHGCPEIMWGVSPFLGPIEPIKGLL